jgi:tRNA nucleotidyltransferase (CCA-adding enzyme)
MSRDEFQPHPESALRPPGAVLRIAQRLEDAGHETWCVGGAVRDALLGHTHLDWDLATAATPKQVRKLFPRTVPVGIDFGTVGVLDDAGVMHEVTTFRHDVRTDGRHAVVEFGASLEDDLARRDFTVNAIAWSPTRRELCDPFGGRRDLERGMIRAVGAPDERMREDRLRALRGIRFAARFGFEIDPETWEAIARSAPHLGRLSAERVHQELEKTMEQVERPSAALEMWRRAGALATLIPGLESADPLAFATADELTKPRGGPRNDERRTLRITAAFLDLPEREAAAALKALRFSNREVAWISGTIGTWHRVRETLEAVARGERRLQPAERRRLVATVGRLRVRTVWRLLAARCAAATRLGQPSAGAAGGWGPIHSLYREALRLAFRGHAPLELADLAVDGDDLRRAGVPPGPEMGRTLAQLLDDVLEDPARNTREWLLARVAERRARGEEER